MPGPLAGAAFLATGVLIGDIVTAAPLVPILADATVVALVFLTLRKAAVTAERVATLPTREELEHLRATIEASHLATVERVSTVLSSFQDDFGRRVERLEDRAFGKKGHP